MTQRRKEPTNGRKKLDYWFPTAVRWGGFVLAFALVGASILGHGKDLAAGYVLAAGMIAYKTVHDAATSSDDR